MDKVVIWGTGSFYDKYVSKYVNDDEISVSAFVSGLENCCTLLDGKPVVKPKDIANFEYDYLIIASEFYEDILKQIKKLNYVEMNDKIINGKVFKHPCFDWSRYKKIKENVPSLITEACWGGYIYNQLALPFTSPFINTRIQQYEYIKLLGNLEYYLQRPLELVSPISIQDVIVKKDNISWGKAGYPIFALDDIHLHAIHAKNEVSYIEEWERRIKRIDWENILVLMIIENDDIAEKFAELKIKNKIGFYYKDVGCQEIVCLKEWKNYDVRLRSGHDFLSYVHHLIWDENYLRYIDIFKMLSLEKDFLRFQ